MPEKVWHDVTLGGNLGACDIDGVLHEYVCGRHGCGQRHRVILRGFAGKMPAVGGTCCPAHGPHFGLWVPATLSEIERRKLYVEHGRAGGVWQAT